MLLIRQEFNTSIFSNYHLKYLEGLVYYVM